MRVSLAVSMLIITLAIAERAVAGEGAVSVSLRPIPIGHWESEYSDGLSRGATLELTLTSSVAHVHCTPGAPVRIEIRSRTLRQQFHGPDELRVHGGKQVRAVVRSHEAEGGAWVRERLVAIIALADLMAVAEAEYINLYADNVKMRLSQGDAGALQSFARDIRQRCRSKFPVEQPRPRRPVGL